MASSISPSQKQWTCKPECSDAGTIRLSGIHSIDSQLQESILPHIIRQLEDKYITENEIRWLALSEVLKPVIELQHSQNVWVGLIVSNFAITVFSRASLKIDKARLLAASFPQSVERLLASPISLVGLKLSDKAIRVSVAQKLGRQACEPHTCIRGKHFDVGGLHGLAC